MRWAKGKWEAFPALIISNSFTHNLYTYMSSGDRGRVNRFKINLDNMVRDATDIRVSFTKVVFEHLLNPSVEHEVMKEVLLEALAGEVAEVLVNEDEDIEEAKSEDGILIELEKLDLLALSKYIVEKMRRSLRGRMGSIQYLLASSTNSKD